MKRFVRDFATLGMANVPEVGGKNASLGEMIQALGPRGILVPGGFSTTAEAYRHLLNEANLEAEIRELLAGLDPAETEDLARRGEAVRTLLQRAPLPEDLVAAIDGAYASLCERVGVPDLAVAVRSSATAEDLPEASFAGQQETFLNVRGRDQLLQACQQCYASLFTDRAIAYREAHGFDHLDVALAIGVQRMVRADLGAAGVMFTVDTESGFEDLVIINAAYGLGESVVRGLVNPDEHLVFKPALARGLRAGLKNRLGEKQVRLVYDERGGTRFEDVTPADRGHFALTEAEVEQLARWGLEIEAHYSERAGRAMPMDIEWARDGLTGELFILQARPETVQAQRDRSVFEVYRLETKGELLATGRAIGARIGTGIARHVTGKDDMAALQEGEVLVTEMTDPDWVPVMRRAAAIVTERGGRTCHAAIVSRELGVPAVVGAEGARERLESGQALTVSCADGELGQVFAGRLPFQVERHPVDDIPQTRTQIMLNLADPDAAFERSRLPVSGVGLARMEFIITGAIGIHPMALLRYPDLEDAEARDKIAAMTTGYANKADYFVDRLAEGIAMIAAAFFPRPVILRFSDFKSNEYAGLIGGAEFEPLEANPMLGFRGAGRYAHPRFREAFALECAAVKRVRNEMGLDNLKLMLPFCRSPEEGTRAIAEMEANGLTRGEKGPEVYVMVELPTNALRIADYASIFDGFSIGSNDLTQLVLGVDRDSELVAEAFDERDPAVKRLIRLAIEEAHAAGKPIGICGQAPSDHPEFAEFLVDCGIDSMSLSPDSVLPTLARVAELESRS